MGAEAAVCVCVVCVLILLKPCTFTSKTGAEAGIALTSDATVTLKK